MSNNSESHWVIQTVAGAMRGLQTLSPRRPLGFTRVANWLSHHLPVYEGVVQLDDGLRFQVNTASTIERSIFFVGDFHRVLTSVLRRHVKPGAFCLDVGANVGFYTLKLAHWTGPTGRVAAFEPNPAMAARIAQNVRLNGFEHVDIVGKAVDRRVGRERFYISENPLYSSLNVVSDAQRVLDVDIITLDDYVASAGWPRVDAIKIDVEGRDCSVLLGAANVLTQSRPLVTLEYDYATDPAISQEAFALLKRLGYTVFALIFRTGTMVDFDPEAAPLRYSFDLACFPEL